MDKGRRLPAHLQYSDWLYASEAPREESVYPERTCLFLHPKFGDHLRLQQVWRPRVWSGQCTLHRSGYRPISDAAYLYTWFQRTILITLKNKIKIGRAHV